MNLLGRKVIILDGSSDGYTGEIIQEKMNGCIRVKREDGICVDVPKGSYHVYGENDPSTDS